ncbi:MAG: hypothetical protein JSR46_01040 [Verrucomicrobia bacterium]|nr:hypothetical protein [Verrucomicrobiota bacterium]
MIHNNLENTSVDQLETGLINLDLNIHVHEPLSFIQAHIDGLLSQQPEAVSDNSHLIAHFKKVIPILSGEEILFTLSALFASSLYQEETTETYPIKTLTFAMCELLTDFFTRETKQSFKSLFGDVCWAVELSHQKAFGPEYWLQAYSETVKHEIAERRKNGSFEIITAPFEEIDLFSHPYKLIPENTLHEWHALCYWLSYLIPTDGYTLKQVIVTSRDWANQSKHTAEELAYVEAGFAYFVTFFRDYSIKELLPCLQESDITHWLKLPLSYSLGLSSKDALRGDTHKCTKLFADILLSEDFSPQFCLQKADNAFLLNAPSVIELSDLTNLLTSIKEFSAKTKNISDHDEICPLGARVKLVLKQMLSLVWYFDPLQRTATDVQLAIRTLSLTIIQTVADIERNLGVESKDPAYSPLSRRLISCYCKEINTLHSKTLATSSKAASISKAVTLKTATSSILQTLLEEVLLLYSEMSNKKLQAQARKEIESLPFKFTFNK